jgi:hypothetical protein
MPDRGKIIYEWILKQIADGRTVYAATAWKVIKIQKKHLPLVRYHNGHCEVARGKNWDSINFCKITAE